jgi:hypothetical protein
MKTKLKYTMFALPLVLLVVVGTTTNAQAYWPGAGWGHWGQWGWSGYRDYGGGGYYHNYGLSTIYQIGYNAGYVDGSQGNNYSCDTNYHSYNYCNGYQA